MPSNSAPKWSASFLASLTPEQRTSFLAKLTPEELESLRHDWSFWARPEQRPPSGDWRTWLILAGRGAGKTRSGAEWVRACACGATPLTGGSYSRIALVAETAADARDVMVEGPSGLLAVHPPAFRPKFETSKRRLTARDHRRWSPFSSKAVTRFHRRRPPIFMKVATSKSSQHGARGG